ncbi:MBL fold metallo-hydrolase [bacterium]|nr:MBL fold metallo-hydrolase [bacterium]
MDEKDASPFLVVLGIAQDAGYPAAGCRKHCCQRAWDHPEHRRHCACLAIVDPASRQRWLLDCTPDFPAQLNMLDTVAPVAGRLGVEGILLTHGHIGHYTGLIHLGREALDAHRMPIHAMPRMRKFLETNGPWDQLVSNRNIDLQDLVAGRVFELFEGVSLSAFLVTHRDEYTETVGFRIIGPQKTVVYLPDIDSWDGEGPGLAELLDEVDTAFIDGTFYAANELPSRDMDEIAHPLITETIERLKALPNELRAKVRFLHFNHSNPVLDPASQEAQAVAAAGCGIAAEMEIVEL